MASSVSISSRRVTRRPRWKPAVAPSVSSFAAAVEPREVRRGRKVPAMESSSGVPSVKRNFILQQGLEEPPAASCSLQYSSLHFQPRLVGLIVLVAVILQDPRIFLALGG